MGELDRTGSVSLLGFYARRIKRLMPQALLAILAVIVLARLLLSPLRADAVAGDVVAAALSAMNWHLSAEAADYFAAGSAGPLDHFWSLAVEEQFYLLWPLLLLGVTWPWRRRGARAHRIVLVVLVVIATASLAYAVQLVATGPEQAYFSTPARAWELAARRAARRRAGGPPARPARRRRRRLVRPGGDRLRHGHVRRGHRRPRGRRPGAGARRRRAGGGGLRRDARRADARAHPGARAVRRAPLLRLVRVALARAGVRRGGLGPAVHAGGRGRHGRLAAAGAADVPVDRGAAAPLARPRPDARAPRSRPPPPAPRWPSSCGLALAATLPTTPTLAEGDADGAARLERTSAIQRSAARAAPVAARRRRGPLARRTTTAAWCPRSRPARPACVYGDRGARTTVVLFGDSHAMQYFPALQRIAGRRHWRLVELTKAACPPAARARPQHHPRPRVPRVRRVARARAAADRARRAPGHDRRDRLRPLHGPRARPGARPRGRAPARSPPATCARSAPAAHGRADRPAARHTAPAVRHPGVRLRRPGRPAPLRVPARRGARHRRGRRGGRAARAAACG